MEPVCIWYRFSCYLLNLILFYFDTAVVGSIIPLIPSPGSPNITLTFQSSSASTIIIRMFTYSLILLGQVTRVSLFRMVFLGRASGQKRLYSLMLPRSLLTVLFVVSFFAVARKKGFYTNEIKR